MGVFTKEKDPEVGYDTASYENPSIAAENVVHKDDDLYSGDGWYSKLQRAAGKLGVEARGIERVPEDERTDTSASKMATVVSGKDIYLIQTKAARCRPVQGCSLLPFLVVSVS